MQKAISLLLVLLLFLSIGQAALAVGTDNFQIRAEYGNFSDVSSGDWFYASVKTANEYGLVKGNPDGSFNPTGSLTVAEAIVMADRVHQIYYTGRDTLENGTPWYQTYVDYALENGIALQGDFDSYTRPITRAEMAYLFAGAVPYEDFEMLNDPVNACPPDGKDGIYAEEIAKLYQYGIATGSDIYGTFSPDANIKRCEAAAIIARVAEPEQRRTGLLLEKLDYNDHVSVVMPVGAAPVSTAPEGYDEGVEADYGLASVSVYKAANVTGGRTGLTVLNISRDQQQAEIADALGVEVTASTLAFGSVPAYRFDFSLTAEDGAAMDGCCYVLVQDCEAYTIILAVQHAAGELSGPRRLFYRTW